MYRYNYTGENKHIMLFVYEETPKGYFSYYYEDYEGSKVISTISTNLKKTEIKKLYDLLLSQLKNEVPDWLINEFEEKLQF